MWNSVGYGSVLYMSVLAGIDTSLYEAAEIDGANKWQQIRHITASVSSPDDYRYVAPQCRQYHEI